MFLCFFLAFAFGDTCSFEHVSSLADTIAQTADPSRDLAKIFGLNTSRELPNITTDTSIDSLLPYVYGLAGFAVPIALVNIILILFFIVGQIVACCPCMKPQKSSKMNCRKSIKHISFCVIWVVSIILFFVASAKITRGLNQVSDVVPEINTTINDVFGVFDTTVSNSTTFIDKTLDNATTIFNEFIDVVEGNLTAASNSATGVITSIDAAKSKADNSLKNNADNFDTKIDNIHNKCANMPTFNLVKEVTKVSNKLGDIKDNSQGLQTATTSLTSTKNEIKKVLANVTGNVKDKVDEFTGTTIKDLLGNLHSKTDSFTDFVKPATDAIDTAKKYINPVIYSVVSFMTVVCIIFCIIYFMTNCCAKFFACTYCTWALIIILIVGVPSIVFSVLFNVLFDACPKLEEEVTSLGHSMLSNEANLGDILLCPDTLETTSIYKLADLQKYFDYQKTIEDLNESLQGTVGEVIPNDSVFGELDNVGSMTDSDFNISKIASLDTSAIYKGLETYQESGDCPDFTTAELSSMKTDLDNMNTDIESIAISLNDAKNNLGDAISVSKSFPPTINQTTFLTKNLISEFTDGTLNIINDGVDGLNCKMICRIYSPAKNALCVSLVDSMSYWLLSGLLMIFALASIAISICERRKTMLPPQTKSDSETDYD